MLTTLDDNFAAYTFNAATNLLSIDLLEKEFNLGWVSGGIMNKYPLCSANTLQSMMRCPLFVTRNTDMSRNVSRCLAWLNSGLNRFPKYTVDANPYLMRESNPRIHNIIELNKRGKYCVNETNNSSTFHHERERTPLMIAIIREPANRTISYFNYFLTRSDTIPLEDMLEIEMQILEKPRMARFLRVLRHHSIFARGNGAGSLFEEAQVGFTPPSPIDPEPDLAPDPE